MFVPLRTRPELLDRQTLTQSHESRAPLDKRGALFH